MEKQMKNVVDLRNELISIFDQLKAKEISHADAKELNNCAGKIINSVKVELEYAGLCKVTPNIAFLNAPKTK
jgi:demethoxyubiquinone hydroxylase (CLK1/Coq7/Cat5 family)